MNDSLFWRVTAWLFIAALLGITFGLNGEKRFPEPRFASPAFADDEEANVRQPDSKAKLHFQSVPTNWHHARYATVVRAKVPGGWLVAIDVFRTADAGGSEPTAITFYPDPRHQWDGTSLPLQ